MAKSTGGSNAVVSSEETPESQPLEGKPKKKKTTTSTKKAATASAADESGNGTTSKKKKAKTAASGGDAADKEDAGAEGNSPAAGNSKTEASKKKTTTTTTKKKKTAAKEGTASGEEARESAEKAKTATSKKKKTTTSSKKNTESASASTLSPKASKGKTTNNKKKKKTKKKSSLDTASTSAEDDDDDENDEVEPSEASTIHDDDDENDHRPDDSLIIENGAISSPKSSSSKDKKHSSKKEKESKTAAADASPSKKKDASSSFPAPGKKKTKKKASASTSALPNVPASPSADASLASVSEASAGGDVVVKTKKKKKKGAAIATTANASPTTPAKKKAGAKKKAAAAASTTTTSTTKEPPPLLLDPIEQVDPEKQLLVLVCSGNLGNAEPSLLDMAAWIPTNGECSLIQPLPETKTMYKDQFDLVAVGMQESTWSARKEAKRKAKLNKEKRNSGDNLDDGNSNHDEDDEDDTQLLNELSHDFTEDDDDETRDGSKISESAALSASTDEPSGDEMAKKDISKLASFMESTLGSDYRLFAEKQRGQMRLVIFVRKPLYDQVTDLTIKCENTGVAGVMANKGGIVMSLTFQKTRLSFVSAHLAAHEGDSCYQARCDNVVEILNGAKTHSRYDVSISSHHLFVLGDLNFRTRFPDNTNKEDSIPLALSMIERGKYDELYQHDELQQGMRRGDVLVDCKTLPCPFPPTFKVLRNAGFDYKYQRTPSYTDRIVYRSAVSPDLLQPLSYEACPDFTTSDHKPIRGAFCLTPNAVIDQDVISTLQQEAPYSYKIRLHSLSCTDLPAFDLNGYSDPYIMLTWDFVELRSDHETKGIMKFTSPRTNKWPRTKYIRHTLNPIFGDSAEIVVHVNGPIGTEAMLFVTVMDYDLHSRDDLMGTLPLNLRKDVMAGLLSTSSGNFSKTFQTSTRMDRPLLKNGKHQGRIQFTLDVERSNTRISIRPRNGKKGGGGGNHHHKNNHSTEDSHKKKRGLFRRLGGGG